MPSVRSSLWVLKLHIHLFQCVAEALYAHC
jgi:hypothetical protein